MSREWSVRVLRGWWIVVAMTSAGCVFVSLDPIAGDSDGGAGTAVGGAAGMGQGGASAGTGGAGTGGAGTGGAGTGGAGTGGAGTGGAGGIGGRGGGTAVDAGPDAMACPGGCTTGNSCLGGQCCPTPAAGGTCSLPTSCGCAAGRACYPDTPATGLVCFAITGQREGADCTGATDVCVAGLGCFGGLCKRYCTVDADCPLIDGARRCVQTVWNSDTTPNQPIPGVLICRRLCDPVTPQAPRAPLQSCPPGFGCFSTAAPGATDCIAAGLGAVGDSCADDSDCLAGNYCAGSAAPFHCNKYCFTSADCPGAGACTFFTPPEYAGTRQVGFCPPP
jgi:hypothetical protein